MQSSNSRSHSRLIFFHGRTPPYNSRTKCKECLHFQHPLMRWGYVYSKALCSSLKGMLNLEIFLLLHIYIHMTIFWMMAVPSAQLLTFFFFLQTLNFLFILWRILLWNFLENFTYILHLTGCVVTPAFSRFPTISYG